MAQHANPTPCSPEAAAVVIFARLPIAGKAKTRLAAGVGDANAAEFYRRMAERTFSAVARCSLVSSRTLFFSEAGESDAIAQWMARCTPECHGMRTASQCASRDLGDRMRHALNHVLAHGGPRGGPCDKAVVVGSDIPDVTAEHVDAAVRLLDRHDVVFGPAADGGYYLLGVKRRGGGGGGDGRGGDGRGGDGDGGDGDARGRGRRDGEKKKPLRPDADVDAGVGEGGAHPALFADIPWSTGTVLADSVAAARRAGLSVAPYQSRESAQSRERAARPPPTVHGTGREDDDWVNAYTRYPGATAPGPGPGPGLCMPVLQDIDTVDDLVSWVNDGEGGGGAAGARAEGEGGMGCEPSAAAAAAAVQPRSLHPLRAAAADLLREAGLLSEGRRSSVE